jgi:hypothetical protein
MQRHLPQPQGNPPGYIFLVKQPCSSVTVPPHLLGLCASAMNVFAMQLVGCQSTPALERVGSLPPKPSSPTVSCSVLHSNSSFRPSSVAGWSACQPSESLKLEWSSRVRGIFKQNLIQRLEKKINILSSNHHRSPKFDNVVIRTVRARQNAFFAQAFNHVIGLVCGWL